jgi:hypothetical protein
MVRFILGISCLPLILGANVRRRTQEVFGSLPPISDLIEQAFPTWCIDANENRITDVETCEDGTPNGR